MDGEVTFEGQCLCGAVRYRATADPVHGVICHCSMCRRHSEAPALAFVHFLRQSFTWVRRTLENMHRPPPPALIDCGWAAHTKLGSSLDRPCLYSGCRSQPRCSVL